MFSCDSQKLNVKHVLKAVDEQCISTMHTFVESNSTKFKLECIKILVDRAILNVKKLLNNLRINFECDDIALVLLVGIIKAEV